MPKMSSTKLLISPFSKKSKACQSGFYTSASNLGLFFSSNSLFLKGVIFTFLTAWEITPLMDQNSTAPIS